MTEHSKKPQDWKSVPTAEHTPEQKAERDKATHQLLGDFDAQYAAGLKASRDEDEGAPKVHDVSKHEYVDDVDPAKGDDFLGD